MNWTLIVSLLPALLAELAKAFPATGAPPSGTPAPPAVDPAATATILSAQSVFIKHTQEILNAAQAAGIVNFGTALTVDGVVGPKTTAAMQAVLTKFNIPA